MNKNIHQIDENGNVKKHFTFDEAQKIALEWYHVPSVEEWKQLIYIYLHDIK
jgi:hypothetical protein